MGSITHAKVSAIADDPAAQAAGEVLPSDWNDEHNFSLTKSDVGLGNVDNTSDANKPVSTATQTALNAKQDSLVSGTNIKTINGASVLGSGDLMVSGSATSPLEVETSTASADIRAIGAETDINLRLRAKGTGYIDVAGVFITAGPEEGNTFIGGGGTNASGAVENVSMGEGSLSAITSGDRNNAFGAGSGIGITSGSDNALFGYDAGNSITTGSANVLFGGNAGSAIETGAGNLAFGASCGPASGSLSYTLVIGNGETADNDFDINIGGILKCAGADPDNKDLQLIPRGTGVVQFGVFTSDATASIDGFITIKLADGTTAYLATVTPT